MRILHLAFEDHNRPGSGGGSLRNHEVNRRLVAKGHEVVMVAARYPGAVARVEDGIVYRHIGVGREYFSSILSYQALLPRLALSTRRWQRPPDLIVEDFVPPWSTFGATRLSTVPTVGHAQGYFAAEKARQYHLPEGVLRRVERWGIRGHGHLIGPSRELARHLSSDAPAAEVSIVPLGVEPDEIRAALSPAPSVTPRQIVYLGRLEVFQKGLDLLVEACDGLLEEEDASLVIAGDGQDADAARAMAVDNDRVTFCGRVSGVDKWRLLASSQVCAMPSRYETFGLTALEALACGTPVVGFDIECLRDTVPAGTGTLVEAFDVPALREALRSLLRDSEAAALLGDAGRRHADKYTWASIAEAQESVYLAAAGG